MPYTYDIDVERRLVLIDVTGVITAQEVLAFRQQIVGDPRHAGGMSQLCDFSAATGIDVDSSGVRELASWSFHPAPLRMAIVAQKPEIVGMLRMFGSYRHLARAEDVVQIFPTREAALDWLLEKRASA